ncbi:MAG TPA: biotin transporter BioY [Acidimicrobiales bacterium]|nr:biotin transporter BioY [Acidimicrobiales bacterium]
MTAVAPAAPRTLADVVVPRSVAADVALVVGFAALTALAAQITIPLPWTPVPITGQTFSVLVAGTVLGATRGSLSQLLYVAVGALGAPVYADGNGGWEAATGATGGYLVGFVLAAALVGALADRRQDRQLLTSLPAMLAGNAVIYALGVPWLAWNLGVSGTEAVGLGMAPFLVGDTVKLLAAGASAPAAWRLLRRN